MRTGSAALLGLMLALGWCGLRPLPDPAPRLSGDGAPAIAAALSRRGLTPGGRGAGREVVFLRRWQSLDHLPDLRRTCRSACDGRADVVELRMAWPTGPGRVTLVDLAALDGAGPALDAAQPMPEVVMDCIHRIVAGDPAPCGTVGVTAWRLPFGL